MEQELKTLAAELVNEVLKRFVPTVETIVGLPDAAKAINVKPATLRKMVAQGRIPYISDGKNLKFKITDLNKYIDSHYHTI